MLVEVVVCAVGRVVILPLVEMTAQSTALPALVTCDRGIEPDQNKLNRDAHAFTMINYSLKYVHKLSNV